jgi:hypothetical protein
MYLLVSFIKIGSAARQNPGCFQNSLLRVSASLREDLGWGEDGALAPEAWVRSARRPYPIFSIRVDSRDSRGFPKTAEDCHFYNDFFVASCLRVSRLVYSYLSAAWQNPGRFQNSLLRVPAPLREDLGWGRRRICA